MKSLFFAALLVLGACQAPTHGQFVHYHGKKCEVVAKHWSNGRWIFHLRVPGPRSMHHMEFVPEEYVCD